MARRKRERTDRKPYLEKRYTPCWTCGRRVVVWVEPGTRTPYKICNHCLDSAGTERVYGHTGAKYVGIAPKTKSPAKVGCKVYRPGDRGFKVRAQEIMARRGEYAR